MRPVLPLLSAVLLTACDDPEPPVATETGLEDTGTETTGPSPVDVLTDLALDATLVGADALNPHGDGSGMVELTATAADAVDFTFELGDGATVDSPAGVVQHTYELEGTNPFDVTVTAVTEDGESASLTETITVYRSNERFRRLVWADEFEGSGSPDPDKWHHQVIPPNNGGWFNGELQHYTDRLENSFVSDGTLKIVARAEPYTVDGSLRDYTSARLNAKHAFTYGRVEVSARLPDEAGTWPAIWTLGANINEVGNYFGTEYGDVGWPACGEIDILEQTGWDKQSTIAHFHWGNTVTSAYENEGGSIANPTSTTEFRVYALEWDEARLRVFVDDALVHELANTADRPYDNPHYLLLNIAMGGNLGGVVPGDFAQATMEIDYVRLYR